MHCSETIDSRAENSEGCEITYGSPLEIGESLESICLIAHFATTPSVQVSKGLNLH